MTRQEIEERIKSALEDSKKADAELREAFQRCNAARDALYMANRKHGECESNVQKIRRGIASLKQLLADVDVPQLNVKASTDKDLAIIITRQTSQRIYWRFAGVQDCGEFFMKKSPDIPVGWSIKPEELLTWAKSQPNGT